MMRSAGRGVWPSEVGLQNDIEFLQRLIIEAPAGIAVLRGPDHVFELVNTRFEAYTRRSKAQLLGRAVKVVFPEIADQGYISLLDSVLSSGKNFVGNAMEVTFADDAGVDHLIYVDFVYQPTFDAVGHADGIFVLATEVTQQVHARREVESLARDLRLQRDRFQQVVDVLPQGIAIGDATGAITYSNAEARRIWGQPAVAGGVDEYVEYGLWSIDGKPLAPSEIAYSRSLLKGEIVNNEQMLVGNKEHGTRIPLLQNSAPLRDEDGEIVGAVIAFADITRLKELERQKDDFLGLVSHEMRTPLTTIIGNADALTRHGDKLAPEAIASAQRDIRADAERLQQIVENMLALSWVESHREIELEPVLLNRLITNAVDDHRRRFSEREIVVSAASDECVVDAVPSYVLQVVGNLLSNAEKYGPAGAPIEVTVSREERVAVVRVLDRGRGVPGREAAQIFEPFYRSDGSAQRAAGMGLGLSVCKRLIAIQGGEIWCSPREGGGSEFGFSLALSPE